jgi:hypothetical protein
MPVAHMERSAVTQQGQVFELKRRNRDGQPIWAYRYRLSGRGSRRVQRGGFASEQDAADALERDLERVRRERRIPRTLTLAELVETYLAQHDVQRVTIEKLRWLLSKAIAEFGDRRVGELTSQEIAAWRMTLSPGCRFEATQALRQDLHRAVVWGMIDINPAKVGVDNPTPRRKEQRPFESWPELEAVAAALGPRHGPMVIFAAATGLRPAEWLALEKRDIDREGCVAYVRRSFTKGELKLPKTEASLRAVPLQTRALDALERLPTDGDSLIVFPGERGGLPRPTQLSLRPLETGSARRRHRSAPPGLRSSAHLRDLRAPCRHLHLRPLPLHGCQPDDDRSPLRPSRPRRARARHTAARLTQRLNASRGRWWTLRGRRINDPRQQKRSLSRRDTKPSDGLEPSTPSLPFLTASGRNPPQRFWLISAVLAIA